MSLPTKPEASSEAIRKTMQSNKGKNTKPEKMVRQALWAAGVRGYRVNLGGIPGTPDICFTKWKLAIFINGCYWHRCPYCNLSIPKTNSEFWIRKFRENQARDSRNLSELDNIGWQVLTIWECKIKEDLGSQIERIILKLVLLKIKEPKNKHIHKGRE